MSGSFQWSCPSCGTSHVVTPPSAPSGGPPKAGTLTGQVWGVFDSLTGSLGRVPTRKEVIQKGLELGLNYSTIVTQYQRVKTFRGSNPLPVTPKEESVPVTP